MMKSTFILTTFAFIHPFFVQAAPAPQDGLSLVFYVPTSDLLSFTANAEPIGTASDGSETTFLFTEVNHVTNAAPNGPQVTDVTLPGTLVASASGFNMELQSATLACHATGPDVGQCIGSNADGAQVADAGPGVTRVVALAGSPASPTSSASAASSSPSSGGASSSGSGNSGSAPSAGASNAGSSPTGSATAPSGSTTPTSKNGALSVFGGNVKFVVLGVVSEMVLGALGVF